MLQRLQRLVERIGDGGLGVLDPQPVHGLAKEFAVLGHFDGRALGADQLDTELVQHAHVVQRQRGVEPRLPAHGGQQSVGTLFLDDLGDHLGRDRLDIGGIGQGRVGHDGGGVGVDQDDPVAFLLQRLAGLGAGIVELAGLADDDGARADNHDGLNIGSFRHVPSPHRLRQIAVGLRGKQGGIKGGNSGQARGRAPWPVDPRNRQRSAAVVLANDDRCGLFRRCLLAQDGQGHEAQRQCKKKRQYHLLVLCLPAAQIPSWRVSASWAGNAAQFRGELRQLFGRLNVSRAPCATKKEHGRPCSSSDCGCSVRAVRPIFAQVRGGRRRDQFAAAAAAAAAASSSSLPVPPPAPPGPPPGVVSSGQRVARLMSSCGIAWV